MRALAIAAPFARTSLLASASLAVLAAVVETTLAAPSPRPPPYTGGFSGAIGVESSFNQTIGLPAYPCDVHKLNVSTGLDRSTNSLVALPNPVRVDPGWRVIQDPIFYNFDPNWTHEARPAFVVQPASNWTAPFPPATCRWIGPNTVPNEEVNGEWVFGFKFGVLKLSTTTFSAILAGSFAAEDEIRLFINSNPIPIAIKTNGPTSSMVLNVPLKTADLRVGCDNYLYARVKSTTAASSKAIGFALSAAITAVNSAILLDPRCCLGGTVHGKKCNDFDLDSNIVPCIPMAGIPFVLSGTPSTGGTLTRTTLSDHRGDWSFLDVPPGNYSVSELWLTQCIQTFPFFPVWYGPFAVKAGAAVGSLDFGNWCDSPPVKLWMASTDVDPLLDCPCYTCPGTGTLACGPRLKMAISNNSACTITKMSVYATSPALVNVYPATVTFPGIISPSGITNIPAISFGGPGLKKGAPLCLHFTFYCANGSVATELDHCFWVPCVPTGCPNPLEAQGGMPGLDQLIGSLLANWGGSGDGDYDGNGVVDGADLDLLLDEYWAAVENGELLEQADAKAEDLSSDDFSPPAGEE